ncbi:DUF2806 domain-containing protein, partial [Vibrio cholerae]|uniref:DUF2806 domain-containing protein n=1 Tax=Vibrio cholerae TaxID=666 RepID=UPI003F653FD3
GFTSMKALKVLQDMTPKEAQILQRAAALACSFGSDTSLKLLIGYKAQNRAQTGTGKTAAFGLPLIQRFIE